MTSSPFTSDSLEQTQIQSLCELANYLIKSDDYKSDIVNLPKLIANIFNASYVEIKPIHIDKLNNRVYYGEIAVGVDLQKHLQSNEVIITKTIATGNNYHFENDSQSYHILPIIAENMQWGVLQIASNDSISQQFISSIGKLIGSYFERIEKVNQKNVIAKRQNDISFYENLLNNIPADIVVFDLEQRYLFVNKNSIKNDEIREWIIGKDDFDFCRLRGKNIKIAEERRARFNQMLIDKKPYSFEERFDLPDGKYIMHLRIMHPIFDHLGNITNAIGYGLDITQIKMQEDVIKKQNETISFSPDGIALLDAEGKYYYMNRAHEQIFEYEPGELIGKSYHMLYENDERERVDNEIFPLLAEKGSWSGETRGITKSGKHIYQDIALRFLPDGTLVCITRDISPLKQSLHLLEQANQKLELAINVADLGMWEWDSSNDLLRGNFNFNHILGYDENEVLTGDRWLDSIHPDDKQKVAFELDKIRKDSPNFTSYLFNYEYRIRTKQGNYIWVIDVGKVAQYHENGQPKELIGLILNITQNKQYEEQIIKSEKRYRDLVENLREVIFETDQSGNFIFLNPAWSALTGFKLEESIGKPIIEFIHPNFLDKYQMELSQFYHHDELVNFHQEIAFLHKIGFEVWFDIEINKVKHLNDGMITIVGSIENITTRKLAEEELKNALEKEKELGELKSRFVSMASHEFRTPLSGIRSSAELMQIYAQRDPILKSSMFQHGIDKKVENIIFDVDRITLLMTDILTMGKIESAKIACHLVPTDLIQFIEGYIKNDSIRYLDVHQIKFKRPKGEIMANIDTKLITHVFNNLVNNAAKYSPPESLIQIDLEVKNNKAIIQFKDKGIGIPEEELPFMFDSFYRGSNVEMIPGTGLGLPIAKYFMEMQHGSIDIKSKKGAGTTVILSLPIY